MMRVGRITTVYEIPTDNRGSSNQNFSGGGISFSNILQQQFSKLSAPRETAAKEAAAVPEARDSFEPQPEALQSPFIGLYNHRARIYIDSILGTMQHPNLILPDTAKDTDDYDAVEGVYRSNKG